MPLAKLRALLSGKKEPRIPDPIWFETLAALPFCGRLNAEETNRLRALCERFLADKEFATAGGLELNDAMTVSIAVQGCLKTPHMNYRRGVLSIANTVIEYVADFLPAG